MIGRRYREESLVDGEPLDRLLEAIDSTNDRYAAEQAVVLARGMGIA